MSDWLAFRAGMALGSILAQAEWGRLDSWKNRSLRGKSCPSLRSTFTCYSYAGVGNGRLNVKLEVDLFLVWIPPYQVAEVPSAHDGDNNATFPSPRFPCTDTLQ